jgi:UDP-glucose 4-epimerase
MIKKILLTGATGFIGSHLLREFINNGYSTVIIKRSTSDTWRIDEMLDKASSYDCDKIDLEEIFSEEKVDCVVHVATNYIKTHKNRMDAESMLDDNIKFPAVLAELCVKYGTKYFINTGTFFEYKAKKEPIDENNSIEPYNFYAATKVAFGELLKYYSNHFDFNVIDLKLFSPFGEKDNEKLVVSLIRSLIDDRDIDLSGGEQRFNFTYVKDIAKAYLCALGKIEKQKGYDSFSVGYNEARSVKEVAEMLEEISGKKLRANWGARPYSEEEIFYSNCRNEKLMDFLDWHPEYDLKSGLKETYNYYLNNK